MKQVFVPKVLNSIQSLQMVEDFQVDSLEDFQDLPRWKYFQGRKRCWGIINGIWVHKAVKLPEEFVQTRVEMHIANHLRRFYAISGEV